MAPRILAAVLLLAFVALGAACGGDGDENGGASSWEGEAIRIGSVFSTSGPGVAFGPQQVRAVRLALDRINTDGGIHGAQLAVEQIDDHSDPRRGARAVRRLSGEHAVLAILGPTFSNSAARAHPVADRLGTPVLAVSNTGPGIVGDCPYRCELVFRDSLGEAAAIPANVASFASTSDARSAIVVHPLDDPFGESTAKIAAEALADNGIKPLGTEVFAPDEAGPQPAIEAALKREAEVLFVTASSGEVAATVIEIARELGFEGKILGGNALNSALTAEEAGRAGEGARSAAGWYAGNESAANRSFVADYRVRYDAEPDQFAAQAYTGVMLLAEAARSADLRFQDLGADRLALAESLASVQMETPLGEFSFTADHDVSQPIWIVEIDGEGGYELIEELPPE